MRKRITSLAAAGTLGTLCACTSGQSAVVPPQTAVNVGATSKLQFAVGTANIAGTAGLNTVVTFRQTDGLSAVLVDTPTITGPSGFVVPTDPNVSGNVDSGTNTITGSPQVASGVTPTATTFGESGGAFAYGFAPLNSDNTGSANFGAFALPFYATKQLKYILGPGNSYVANFRNGTQGAFPGYASGFTDFAATPVAGTYGLSVAIPTTVGNLGPFTASATLTSTALLPTFAPPAYSSDGAGGGTLSVTVPTGCTEALVYVLDITPAGSVTYYTLLTRATGAQTLTLPDALGPIVSGTAGPTIPSGDSVAVYAVGFDYPAIEASPIGSNPPQSPTIVGANGQADITVSGVGATATENVRRARPASSLRARATVGGIPKKWMRGASSVYGRSTIPAAR